MLSNDKEKQLWNLAQDSVISDVKKIQKIHELQLGSYYSANLQLDIKHLTISFARYKFISKLFRFEEKYSILELGCTEGIGSFFFMQPKNCSLYQGIDFDGNAISWAKTNLENENIKFIEEDFLNQKYGEFNAVISVDVIEHIQKEKEEMYLDTIHKNVCKDGTAIIGTPNITMNPYASKASKLGHVNLFSQERLYQLCKTKFHHVFIFNMTDEIVHTGMDQMSCYIFAVCTGKK